MQRRTAVRLYVWAIGFMTPVYSYIQPLFEDRVQFVMTSNYRPDQLYPNGLHRDRLIPAIKLLEEKLDILNVDVFSFGILSDFRTSLFPGSMRLIELADRVNPLQVEALCWCGLRATHNARIINGRMTREGDQLVPGDTSPDAEVVYEVLCRKHHMANMSSKDHEGNG